MEIASLSSCMNISWSKGSGIPWSWFFWFQRPPQQQAQENERQEVSLFHKLEPGLKVNLWFQLWQLHLQPCWLNSPVSGRSSYEIHWQTPVNKPRRQWIEVESSSWDKKSMRWYVIADTSVCWWGNPVSWLLQSRSCDIGDVRTTTRTKIPVTRIPDPRFFYVYVRAHMNTSTESSWCQLCSRFVQNMKEAFKWKRSWFTSGLW